MRKVSRRTAFLFLGVLAAGCMKIDGTLITLRGERAAPAIAGSDSNDQFLQLSDSRGKVVLLEFWRST